MIKGIQNSKASGLAEVLVKNEASILEEWLKEMSGATRRSDLIKESDLRAQCTRFLRLLRQGVESDGLDLQSSVWQPLREQLEEISRSRAQQGFSATETATFVLSVKRPLFQQLREQSGSDASALASEFWTTTELIDSLGLYTTEIHSKTREELMRRQQEEML